MYLVKLPTLLRKFYPSLIWHMPRNEKVIYLTFDDGPIPDVTEFVLKTLNIHNVKATFFCIGDNIIKYPEIFKSVLAAGHSIGNHTFNHLKGWATDDATYLSNVVQCQALINTPLFRPPYGRIKRTQIQRIHREISSNGTPMNIVMWDVLSGDFDTSISGEKCFKNVINNTENGSIIVFHDSLKAFERLEYALPRTIQYFKERGFTFGQL